MRPTQFINSRTSTGMKLRSGRTINCLLTSDLSHDMNLLLDPYHTPLRKFNNYVQFSFRYYCDTCYKIIGTLYLAERHGKDLRGETNVLKGDNKDFSTSKKLYKTIRDKIAEFIQSIDEGTYRPCECDLMTNYIFGEFYEEYMEDAEEHLNSSVWQTDYEHMKDYTGYGPERAQYRLYHNDFFKLKIENYTGQILLERDFKKVRDELAHWLVFFNQKHCIDIKKKKAFTETGVTIDDCMHHILSFV